MFETSCFSPSIKSAATILNHLRMRSARAPRLPTDLERLVFSLCAVSEPFSIAVLLRVARRVQAWLEPILWRTITIDYRDKIEGYPLFTWDILMSAIRTKPSTFFRGSVRNLSLKICNHAEEDLDAVLSVCTGVENLSLVILDTKFPFVAPVLAQLITPLRLKHLYIDARTIIRDIPVSAACFSGMTHLELRGPTGLPRPINQRTTQNDPRMWTALACLPHLTHLSFNSAGFLLFSLHLLQTCKNLAVLICLAPAATQEGGPPDFYKPVLSALAYDVRFVAMQCVLNLKDWQMGVHGGEDYWQRAEDFIAQRRAGVVDALQYVVRDDASETLV